MSANTHAHQETITVNSASLIGASESLIGIWLDIKPVNMYLYGYNTGYAKFLTKNDEVVIKRSERTVNNVLRY